MSETPSTLPEWVPKLTHLILPVDAVAAAFALGILICRATGHSLTFDPDTVWVIWVYLAAILAGNLFYFYSIWRYGKPGFDSTEGDHS